MYGYYYLASPYSHPEEHIRHQRFRDACKAAALMLKNGYVVYSPVVHSHSLCMFEKFGSGWEYWKNVDTPFLLQSMGVVVLQLPGWSISEGVLAEIQLARDNELRIWYVDLIDLHNRIFE